MLVEPKKVQGNLRGLPNIKNIIVIASAKGGVGKSTTAANFALSLKAKGYSVGLLDADIYGPNQPNIFGVQDSEPHVDENKKLLPVIAHGIPLMSIGFLYGAKKAVVWRGPMISKAMEQLIHDTKWGELDFLVIDMPPGTGDIPLTLASKIPVCGAVIVSTPQDLAVLDAQKSVQMFEKMGIHVFGAICNMSVYHCSSCGAEERIFGSQSISELEAELGTKIVGEMPLSIKLRKHTDLGNPIIIADPESEESRAYHNAVKSVMEGLSRLPKDLNRKLPPVVVA